jgi:hypothetical protein
MIFRKIYGCIRLNKNQFNLSAREGEWERRQKNTENKEIFYYKKIKVRHQSLMSVILAT